MVKNLSCVSYGSLKRFPHTFTNDSLDAIQLLVEIAYIYEACDVMSFFATKSM